MTRKVTRRNFIMTACMTAGPLLQGLTDKAGSGRPTLGQGSHTYEAIHDWGELPPFIRYGNTHGVCEDAEGHIYVHHTVHAGSESSDTMVVFDEKGKFVRSWGRQFKGGAHGLTLRREGGEDFLYLSDHKHGLVTKRTLKGEEVFTLGYPFESAAYQLKDAAPQVNYQPTNVAVAPNGDIYVADGYGSNYINQYNSKAEFIRTFGGSGREPGQLDCPHGLWVDTRREPPVLVVADRSNARLQRFTLQGEHIDLILGTTKLPCHFHERNGEVLVPDLQSKVVILDQKNKVIVSLGNDEYSEDEADKLRVQDRSQFVPGRFICPHSACFDHEGNIFIVEWVTVGRVTKLRRLS